MARVSKAVAESHRASITAAAARLFRERGFAGVSVTELMGAAGLTHGGFYGHFKSKDELAAAACEDAFRRSVQRWEQRVADSSSDSSARAALIERYLSLAARDSPGTSCATPALAGDVAREAEGSAVRRAYAAGVDRLLYILAALQGTGSAEADREAALADFAAMVGALVLSRATLGEPMSEAFLSTVRKRLVA